MRDLGSMSRFAAWRGGASKDSVRASGVPLDDEGHAHLKLVKNLFFLVSSLPGFACRLILGSWNSTDGCGAMGTGDVKKKRLSQPRGHQREFQAGEGEDGAPTKVPPLMEDRPPEWGGADHEDAEVEVKERQPPRQPPEQELNIRSEFCVDDNIGVSTTFGRCGALHQWLVRLYHWSVTATSCLYHVPWLSNSSNQVGDLSADCIINTDERTDEIKDVVERGAPFAEQSVDDVVEESQDAAEEIQDGVGFEEVEDRIAADEDITVNLGGPAGESRFLSGLTSDNYKHIVFEWCPRLDEA